VPGRQGRLRDRSDPAASEQAAASWDALGQPYPAACARLRQAEALLASRAPRAQAEQTLWAAHQVAARLEAAPLRHQLELLAQRGRLRLQAPIEPVSQPAEHSAATALGLTPRAAEVLALVAAGYRNRQIGQALFITMARPAGSRPVASPGVAWPVGCRYSDTAHELGFASPRLATVVLRCPTAEATPVLPRLAYLTLCRSIKLLAQLARGDAAKDLELLVLHHQLAVLHRQTPRPKLEPADRALLAAVSRVLPRSRWSCFFVRPETLVRWHRRLVAGAWTYPRRGPGRPPLDEEVQQLIVRLARENPRWAISASGEKSCASGCRSRHPRSERPSAVMDSTPSRVAQPRLGGRSCVSRPPGSSPATSSPSTRSRCGGCMCCSSSSWTLGESTWLG
jgi:hypothetical protein